MKNSVCFLALLLFLISCKSLKHNDSIINYRFIDNYQNQSQVMGDFQEIELLPNKTMRVMPAYFRNYGSKSQSLIVRIGIDKKYGFRNLGKVKSQQFGKLNAIDHEWVKMNDKFDNLIYHVSLKQIDLAERKQKILKDTLVVTIGNKNLLFTPGR